MENRQQKLDGYNVVSSMLSQKNPILYYIFILSDRKNICHMFYYISL